MRTHDTYTIGRWKTTDGRYLGWSLGRLEGCHEVHDWSIQPNAYRCPLGIVLLEHPTKPGRQGFESARTLPTMHGELARYAVFEPTNPHDDQNYVIVLVESSRGLYYAAEEYDWNYVRGWQRAQCSIFLQTDYELAEILDREDYWNLADETIARRLLEAMYAQM